MRFIDRNRHGLEAWCRAPPVRVRLPMHDCHVAKLLNLVRPHSHRFYRTINRRYTFDPSIVALTMYTPPDIAAGFSSYVRGPVRPRPRAGIVADYGAGKVDDINGVTSSTVDADTQDPAGYSCR